MAITKEITIERMEVLEDGTIQVRECERFLEDGVLKAQAFNRYICTPDMDVVAYDDKIKKVAGTLWTKEVKDAYKAKKANQEAFGV